jgi:hypothetical protein
MQVQLALLKLLSKLSAPAGEVKPAVAADLNFVSSHNFHGAAVFRLGIISRTPASDFAADC